MIRSLFKNRSLVIALAWREIEQRYKGSYGGISWYVFQNLFILGLYSFVFGTLFKARWGQADDGQVSFILLLFIGLITYNFFSENLNRSTSLIASNATYVKKVVFPLELLPVITLLVSAFNSLIAFIIFIVVAILLQTPFSLHCLWVPIVFIPFALMTLGFMWFLSSLSVFVRDVVHIVGLVLMAAMFLSPVFYPKTLFPTEVHSLLNMNPLTIPVEQLRQIILFGAMPDFSALLIYTVLSIIISALGYLSFQKMRKGFSDVL